MAKILCSYSGITFNVDHFPIYLDTGIAAHPIFSPDLKLTKLWKYLPKWQSGELTETDSYLLFLAILKQTELVEWRTPCSRTPATASIISANMEMLFEIVSKMAAIRKYKEVFSHLVISPETKDLGNVKYWLSNWNDQYLSFCDGLKDIDLRSRLARKEAGLERLIKNSAIKPEKYAHLLANWAAEAGDFPESTTLVNNVQVSLSDYWQSIIVKCHKSIDLITIPSSDIAELLLHCETNIDLGSIFSYHLFNTLREGKEMIDGFFSIGSPSFSILGTNPDSDMVNNANVNNLIQSAPLTAPKRTEYANDFQFLRAKMKYQLLVSSQNEGE